MSHNYDRKSFDKENAYDSSFFQDRISKPVLTSNGELRRKFDQNIALIERDEPNRFEDQDESSKPFENVYINKRENARRRGFDMKVSNIDTINDKITGLLSMVGKDRQKEKNQTSFSQISQRQPKDFGKSPKFGLIDRIKKINDSSKNEMYSPKHERSISPFGQLTNKDQKRGNPYLEEMKSKDNQSERFRKIKMRYQEEQLQKEKSQKYFRGKEEKVDKWWNQVLNEQNGDDNMKINRKKDNSIAEQKIAFDKMLEERRKNRKMHKEHEQDRQSTKISHYQNKSAIKPRYSNKQFYDIHQKSKRESPIIKVRDEMFQIDRIEPFKIPSPKNSHIKRDAQHFSKVSYVEEEGHQHKKINSTAKLIDDQLVRIKAKINQSETNQKKIESFKPRNNSDQFQTKEHVTRIAENISAQVQFDNHLKPARQFFETLEGEEKWQELEQRMVMKGIKLDGRVLKELVTIGPDQHNPFGAEKISIQIGQIAELVAAAEKNWQHCVLNCASSRSLSNESFKVADLDLSNKGYLSIEDLVCFVNLYVNTFYRNRDLALVMRRLQLFEGGRTSNNGIQFQTFLSAFST